MTEHKMLQLKFTPSKIGYRLFVYTLFLSFLLIIIAAFLQYRLSYRWEMESIQRQIKQIEASYLQSLTHSFWVMDESHLRIEITGIQQLPNVQYVAVNNSSGQMVMQVGKLPSPQEKIIAYRHPLTHLYKDKQYTLGILRIDFTLKHMYQNLLKTGGVILLILGINIFLVSVLILLLFNRLVTRHLKKMAIYARDFDLSKPGAPLLLLRRETPDELSDVVSSLNLMRERILKDISERQQAQDDLKVAKEELEIQNEALKSLDKMKDGLIRDVSHELKTPIAKQHMQVQILKQVLARHGLQTEGQQIIKVLESSVKRQESVVHNILDLSRLTEGGRKYKISPVRLDLLLENVLADYQAMIEACGMEVSKNLRFVTLDSDYEMLFHVFSNIMNNAIKFRNPNIQAKIDIVVEQDANEVRVKITDNGIGLTPVEQAHVFDSFYQASASTEGSGVGLTIVKRIVSDLNGRITITSPSKNQGLTVAVSFPL